MAPAASCGTAACSTEVRAARERGILFDVGHGMASLDFGVAEAALADGFPPDTISTDVYQRHLGAVPQHDLPRTISKLIAAGMAETAALAAATARPAAALGLGGEIGTLAPGACADLAVLRFNDAGTAPRRRRRCHATRRLLGANPHHPRRPSSSNALASVTRHCGASRNLSIATAARQEQC